jgi:hypothetical protein
MRFFYRWLDSYGGEYFQGSVRKGLYKLNHRQLITSFNDVMQSIYTAKQNGKIDLAQFSKQLFKELKMSNHANKDSPWATTLKLN